MDRYRLIFSRSQGVDDLPLLYALRSTDESVRMMEGIGCLICRDNQSMEILAAVASSSLMWGSRFLDCIQA